jgi:hypothetical protein
MPWFGFERDGTMSMISLSTRSVAWPSWSWPGDFSTQSNAPARQRQAAGDQQTLGYCCGVPTASGESLEDASLGCRFIEVKWLADQTPQRMF